MPFLLVPSCVRVRFRAASKVFLTQTAYLESTKRVQGHPSASLSLAWLGARSGQRRKLTDRGSPSLDAWPVEEPATARLHCHQKPQAGHRRDSQGPVGSPHRCHAASWPPAARQGHGWRTASVRASRCHRREQMTRSSQRVTSFWTKAPALTTSVVSRRCLAGFCRWLCPWKALPWLAVFGRAARPWVQRLMLEL